MTDGVNICLYGCAILLSRECDVCSVCGVITHSAKETGQQKEQYVSGLEVTGKWGCGVGQNL